MTVNDAASNPLGWPVADVDGWFKAWTAAMRAVPHALDQSINPGWSFGPVLNFGNSSAPQTEVEVLKHHSYGRQLGRISDALAVLIAERPKCARPDARVSAFLSMKGQIDKLKLSAAANRLDEIGADLAALKKGDFAEYQRVKAALLQALEG